jgi:hypothetical protein
MEVLIDVIYDNQIKIMDVAFYYWEIMCGLCGQNLMKPNQYLIFLHQFKRYWKFFSSDVMSADSTIQLSNKTFYEKNDFLGFVW